METFGVKTQWSNSQNCILTLGLYSNNEHIAIGVYSLDEGPFAKLTVNLDSTDKWPLHYGYVDTNNFPEAEELIERLHIGRPVGVFGSSGFCWYPLYEFYEEVIKNYVFQEEEAK